MNALSYCDPNYTVWELLFSCRCEGEPTVFLSSDKGVGGGASSTHIKMSKNVDYTGFPECSIDYLVGVLDYSGLHCRTLIFVGDYQSKALHKEVNLNRRYGALVEVQACESMTVEQFHSMLITLEYFLTKCSLQTLSVERKPKKSMESIIYLSKSYLLKAWV
ncbi:hypothetical protein C5167_031489 [Papaver somniferum]|uniref:Uncharacterized protein n=1 Tax=Papaver somniferum TaxID=3469 RepID=A0A4Y7K5Q0_PAPSO|nr:hypothetical protein C5167_031489 [Papaver somniferum]